MSRTNTGAEQLASILRSIYIQGFGDARREEILAMFRASQRCVVYTREDKTIILVLPRPFTQRDVEAVAGMSTYAVRTACSDPYDDGSYPNWEEVLSDMIYGELRTYIEEQMNIALPGDEVLTAVEAATFALAKTLYEGGV